MVGPTLQGPVVVGAPVRISSSGGRHEVGEVRKRRRNRSKYCVVKFNGGEKQV